MDHEPDAKPLPEFVVGIGASAGGLEAIEGLFDGLSPHLNMAYVVVQHLSPDFKSLMDELLARHTEMPIYQAEDGQHVEPNSIYLMPPKKELAFSDGRLIVKDRDPSDGLTFPIDHFFRSLAQDAGDRAIGIILSGTGSDGTKGVCDIHEAAGLVIVQSEESAKFDGMPRSATDSGVADLVISPEQMKEALARYRELPQATELAAATDENGADIDGVSLNKIFGLVRANFGLDLKQYKLNTIVRRTERRILLNKLSHVDDYAALVESNADELQALYADLLIGVTRFFRDSKAFEALESQVAQLLDEKVQEDELRVWIAGCSTGQEAFSIAMLLHQLIQRERPRTGLKIFASDIDARALSVAQQAVYSEEEIADVPEALRTRYFVQKGEGFQVVQELRQCIVFAPHNLLRDAPFTRVDLVVCRNLLIYMQQKAQRKILSLFHFGLRANGVLFLGPSETVAEIAGEFNVLDNRWKLYRKKRDIQLLSDFRLDFNTESRLRESGLPQLHSQSSSAMHSEQTLLLGTYDALLAHCVPNSFLVSSEGQLLHTFGDAGRFLKAEAGRPVYSLSDRILDDLRPAIAAGLRKVFRDRQPIQFASMEAEVDGEKEYVELFFQPIEDSRTGILSCLIQLSRKEVRSEKIVESIEMLPAEQVASLESELSIVKQSLQATIQELETSNEELQSTNEEMLSSNEELQSTNEELQSVNEELYTVNAEHQAKITELSELTRDMDNLLASTEVHTIFLDSELKIRKFTPRVAETFRLLPHDIGRQIDHFQHSIECQDLVKKLANVVSTGEPFEEEVCDHQGNWYLMRLLPYQTMAPTQFQESLGGKPGQGQETNGALLTLINVSRLRETSMALEDSLQKRDEFLAMLSHELRNPLSTIVNATQFLGGLEERGRVGESIAIIQRQTKQMATLLDDLLDVTRVSQGKIQLQTRKFDLLRAVEGAIESVRSRCEAREQEIVVNLPNEPVWIDGSEPRILQVLSNLLTNASKYSPPGENIELFVVNGSDQAEIRVVDNGVGIASENLANIFEIFVQSDRTLDRADGGLGIGLTLVRSLVELHGGEISVRSEGEGLGSEFIVALPTTEAASDLDESGSNLSELSSIRRIVLVEDSVDATKMLAFLLEDAGYQVTIAHDGRRGLEQIIKMRPDAAIIDIGLPEIDGFEVARSIRQDSKLDQTYLIALTGYGRASDREKALSAGFDEHLVKPLDPEILSRLLAGPSIAPSE